MAEISSLYWIVLSACAMATLVLACLYWNQVQKSKEVTELNQEERLAISEFATVIVNHDNMHDVLWELMHSCISRLGFVDGVVYLYDAKSKKLIQQAAFGPKNPKPFEIKNRIEIRPGSGIVGSVAQNQQSEIIPDTSKDPRYIADDEVRLSEIAVPICYKGELIGVIDSEHPQRHFFQKRHLQILEMLSSLCAGKIVKLRALEDRKIYVNRLQTLLEHTPDFIVLSAPNGDCIYANKSYQRFFGVDAGSDSRKGILRSLNPNEKEEFLDHMRQINERNPSFSYIKQSVSLSGRKQWTLWNETGVFDEEGFLIEVISVGRDVSELRRAHESQDVHIRTLEEILQKNSHRVRQPVAQLLGIAQILDHSMHDQNELREMLSYIKVSVSQLDSYTRELNDFVFNSSRA
ncbi:MAG: GAF domain-containing protein [Flavobacteriales bacterium]